MKLLKKRSGYTLIETMIAVSILMVGVGAAAKLNLVMTKQEEANANVGRALNLLENTHRLYQLGLAPAEVIALLPEDPSVTVSNAVSGLTLPAEVNQMEGIDWSVDCTVVPGQADVRRFTARSLRPSIR